ncbi:type II secretion system protein [Patescibacteria group bacterium]|nr:type II secretion system protein [Patescibacteria group bacterium]
MKWLQGARGQSGFTLIEMITVVSIITILSVLVIVSTRVGNQRQQLRDAAAGYVTAARNAESLASASQDVGGTARKAYGVCITSSQLTTSTDQCADPFAAGKPADTYRVYGRSETVGIKDTLDDIPVNPTIVASFKLPAGIEFASPNVRIDYIPPAPTLYVNGLREDATVTIQKNGNNSSSGCGGGKDCQTIQIKPRAGAIYVN